MIQGPPGAGKTTTALLLVRGWTAARRGPVLCCADSNIAASRPGPPRNLEVSRKSAIFCILFPEVDNLTAGCVKAGLKVVRIGRPEATRFDLEKYNLLEMVKDSCLHLLNKNKLNDSIKLFVNVLRGCSASFLLVLDYC